MKKEKYIATLVGCAIGDTLGMCVEGWKREQIKKYVGKINSPLSQVIIKSSNGKKIEEDEFGKLKSYNEGLEVGDVTDDTILTLALAESIIETGGLDIYDIAKKQLKAYESKINSGSKVIFGFGYTTIEGFKNLQNGISPLHSGIIGSPGNAPGMKMSPV